MRSHFKSLLLALSFLLVPFCLAAQDSASALSIRGDVQKPDQWIVEALKARFADQAQDIEFAAGRDKTPNVGTGIPLLTVIQAAVPKVNQQAKHSDLAFFVILGAYDSYRIFSRWRGWSINQIATFLRKSSGNATSLKHNDAAMICFPRSVTLHLRECGILAINL
jgi:hypothetical protein